MNLVERFLKYVSFDTQSDENSETTPSSPKQMVFARYLQEELTELGFEDVDLDQNGYLYATLPSNIDKPVPVVGFIAHMDTSPDMSGANVTPRIVTNYDGSDIILNEADGIVLSPRQYPELLRHLEEDLIVTNGHSLLGADDKAGIAEIVSAMVYLMEHPEIKHGKIRVAFNPDEEIGMGAHKFDVQKFGCEFAYTMDGGEVGELEYENFNAASAKVHVKGVNVHPGTAKNKMVNSMRVAYKYIAMMPKEEIPECTEGYEGFYHLIGMKGDVENTTLNYIIRDHDRSIFEQRKQNMLDWAEELNKKYGKGTVTVELKDQYYNMREKVEPVKYIIDIAFKAMEEAGVTPVIHAIRGGTDGATFSKYGLVTPNLGTGSYNHHGRFEYLDVQEFEKMIDVVIDIVKR